MKRESTLMNESFFEKTVAEDAKGAGDDLYASEKLFYNITRSISNSLDQNREHRKKYAGRTFMLTCCWIFTVLLLVLLSGLRYNGHKIIDLSEKVVIVLITTTTVNVFAFFLLVMQFLFNKNEIAALSFLYNSKKQ